MEPVIRNVRDMQTPETRSPMMISRDDNPPTNTLLFSEVQPGQSSPHHIHTWEHVVYVVQGSGTMFCDEKAYPIKEGDAVLIPPEVDHYTLNDGGAGNAGGPEPLQRIEVNPLSAGLGGARPGGTEKGTGVAPVIRNYRELTGTPDTRIISVPDGAPNFIMIYNGAIDPGYASHRDAGGHTHSWEHMVYVLEGHASLVVAGKTYPVTAGDAVLVPPDVLHQWRNDGDTPMTRITFNPLVAAGRYS